MTGLLDNVAVRFAVQATNAIGIGAATGWSAYYTPGHPAIALCGSSAHRSVEGRAPSPVLSVSAVAGLRDAVVSFTAPVDNGTSPIIEYLVSSPDSPQTATGSQSPITVTNLQAGTSTRFTVRQVSVHLSTDSWIVGRCKP